MTILRYFFNDRSYDIFMKTQSWCDGIVKTRFKGAKIWTLNIYKIIDALLKINPYFTPLQRKSRDALFEIICNYSHWIIRLDNSFVYDREIYLVTFFFFVINQIECSTKCHERSLIKLVMTLDVSFNVTSDRLFFDYLLWSVVWFHKPLEPHSSYVCIFYIKQYSGVLNTHMRDLPH